MNQALVYHYWNDGRDRKHYRNMAYPVVVSVATLRAVEPDIPVYVVDVSDEGGDWGFYPELLDFKVVHRPPQLPVPWSPDIGLVRSTYKYCSSIFDVTSLAGEIPEGTIVFSDSDIFYLEPFLPLEPGDKFNCTREFVGHYYYDKAAVPATAFLSLWKKCITRGVEDLEFRRHAASYYRLPRFFNQESVFVYLCEVASVERSVRFLAEEEHCFEPEYPHEGLKLFHFAGAHFGNRRGLAALAIEEYRNALFKVLGEREVFDVFGVRPGHKVVPFRDRGLLTGGNLEVLFREFR